MIAVLYVLNSITCVRMATADVYLLNENPMLIVICLYITNTHFELINNVNDNLGIEHRNLVLCLQETI